jgi:hypothetical protein
MAIFALPGLPKLGRDRWSCLDTIDAEQLTRLSDAYRLGYPFPHLVIDDLFEPDYLREIADDFAAVPPEQWRRSRHRLQDKLGTLAGHALPDATQNYFDNLHAGPMRRFLTAVTGIADLQGDPTLENAGLHQVPDGGRFELHVDFARHPHQPLKTRLVVITYLNEGWLAEYGGLLELWQWKPRLPGPRIVPEFGRTLIMEVGPRNVHGLPAPVHAPGGESRRSVAAYYYTALTESDRNEKEWVTGYVDRPGAAPSQRIARFLYSALPRQAAAAVRRLFRPRAI